MQDNNNEQWGGEDAQPRHRVPDHLVAMIDLAVDEAMKKHQREMVKHFDQKFAHIDSLIRSAFPGGDPLGHRLSHESQIRAAEFWARVKASLAEKLAFGVVSGGLLFLGLAAWEAIKAKVMGQ